MESQEYVQRFDMEPEADHLNYDSISMRAVNTSTRIKLSQLLNVQQALTNTKNVARDYRGLAELMGFEYIDIRNFERSKDPTKEIIEAWELKQQSSVGALINVLDELERFDVLDEVKPLIDDNVKSWLNSRLKNVSNAENSTKPLVHSNFSQPLLPDMENPLTIDDDVNTVHYYHAYVCYADCDLDFVLKLSDCLENPEVGLKLFIRDRDLQLGVLQYDAYLRLIEERCKHVLVVMSPAFFESPECEFQAKFAAGLGIDQRSNKIIPIVLKPCSIPSMLSCLSKVDFTRPCMWNWEKLIKSLGGNADMISAMKRKPPPALIFNSNNCLEDGPRILEITNNSLTSTTLPAIAPQPQLALTQSQVVIVSEPDSSSANGAAQNAQYRSPNYSNSNSSILKWISSKISKVSSSKSRSKPKSPPKNLSKR